MSTSSSPALITDPVSALLSLLAASPPNTRIAVAIAGVPGSGKSTLAAQLASRVDSALSAPNTACVLTLDGFHYPKSVLSLGVGGRSPTESFARRGAPWTFDGGAFAAALRAAINGDSNAWPTFDHAIGDPEPNDAAIPAAARLLIVEGLYVLFDEGEWYGVLPSLSAAWFLDTPRFIANDRLALRHMVAWNLTREAADERIALNDGPNGDLVVESCRAATARLLPFSEPF